MASEFLPPWQVGPIETPNSSQFLAPGISEWVPKNLEGNNWVKVQVTAYVRSTDKHTDGNVRFIMRSVANFYGKYGIYVTWKIVRVTCDELPTVVKVTNDRVEHYDRYYLPTFGTDGPALLFVDKIERGSGGDLNGRAESR